MTGGTGKAEAINQNLARACHEFGIGMGLGSCRILMEEGNNFQSFNLRHIIGDDLPFYANLGIKQVENAIVKNDIMPILEMIDQLQADGLIIHVNPLQEWIQVEGDRINLPPLETIKSFMEKTNTRIIVKEVGQGYGPESIKELLKLPLEAMELAAFGGTNFARVELNRSNEIKQKLLEPFSLVGNHLDQMIRDINHFVEQSKDEVKCKSVIVSGGIKNFLDGYYYMEKCSLPSIYGQGSAFLQYASKSYGELKEFIEYQVSGLKIASAFLRVKD
ncbi:MAG: isopentenyl-diphosphate delta-isomerase, partial [Bacteroidota bacterium]